MPTLHANSDASGYFAKASLHGRAVVFQLSSVAAQRLTGAGLVDGSRLSQQLLLALIQSGDAYTRPDAGPQSDSNQTALPFGEGELDADGILPRCEETGGHLDLHLVALDDGLGSGRRQARLLALEPRHVLRKQTALSIPVAVLSRRILDQLVSVNKLPAASPAVTALARWFDHRLASAWDELARLRAARQEGLSFERSDELPLQ